MTSKMKKMSPDSTHKKSTVQSETFTKDELLSNQVTLQTTSTRIKKTGPYEPSLCSDLEDFVIRKNVDTPREPD